MNRAKSRNIAGYVERHHIHPKCLGGNNNKSNIVKLTPEEHYLAHQLLVKMYPTNDRLVYAAMMMTVSSSTNILRSNKRYGWLKRKHQLICKSRIGANNPSFGKYWYYDPVSLNNGKFIKDNVPDGWVKGRQPKTQPKIKIKYCRKCNSKACTTTKICRNGQRINRLVENFGLDDTVIGTDKFLDEYYRVVAQIAYDYNIAYLSVEDMRIKYNMKLNETVRCLLRSLNIDRRSQSKAVKNYYR